MFVGITNTPRDYAWGSTTAIADLLGTSPSGGPEAELWLGAHPGSPARLTNGEGTVETLVGTNGLPFLLKVLAAASPLSLQAHPTPQQAREGFERENAEGVPLDAPHRNYKDAFHKPELIYAVSDPFRALCGFRAVAETRELLAALDDERIRPLAERLVDDSSLRDVFEWLLSGAEGVEQVVAAASEQRLAGEEWRTARELAEAYPGDPGIAISLLLNNVSLSPGEVLYLPAGNIHAYLEGLGIELMASSDNVLRGGLTPKHVDVPELLKVLDFRPLPVPYLAGREIAPGVRVFTPDVPDFELVAAQLDGTTVSVELPGEAIALCTSGSVELAGDVLRRGEAALLRDEPVLQLAGEGTVFIATTRLPTARHDA